MIKYEDLIKVIKDRRSVRSYIKDYEIEDDIISKILEAGKHIPSARNIQPLEFIIVKDKKVLEELTSACQQNQTAQVEAAIIIIGDIFLARKVGTLSSHSATTADKGSSVFIYMDAAAATQNILLVATSLGIDTLWISSFHEKEIIRTLNLPDTYVPLVIIPLGKRKNEPFTPPKRPLLERIHHDTFKSIQHDYSYLDSSKLINEAEGELKNYLDINIESAKDLFENELESSIMADDNNSFRMHAYAVSRKCLNICKLINKRKRAYVNVEEMEIAGLFNNLGKLFTNDERFEELASIDFLISKGFKRIANIVGSKVIGMEKIKLYARQYKIKVTDISRYTIDGLEKEILTFAVLTTMENGKDIYFEDKLELMERDCENETIIKILKNNRESLIKVCEKVEHYINQ